MESSKFIQKIIDGRSFLYDKEFDRITTSDSQCNGNVSRNSITKEVDICIEISTACNFNCDNCFCDAKPKKVGNFAQTELIKKTIKDFSNQVIRICVTGGEPLLHPKITEILNLPSSINNCGFIIATNGSLRSEIDPIILKNHWTVAISLHGNEKSHNSYTKSQSFKSVQKRVKALSKMGVVHIYTVLHDELSNDDIDWLYDFRNDSGVKLLRFLKPRPFGRYQEFSNIKLEDYINSKIDEFSSFTTVESNTLFVDVFGEIRHSH